MFVKLFILFGLLSHPAGHLPERHVEVLQELVLISCREQRRAHKQLVEDRPKTPHVNSVVVLNPQHNFRRPVVPTLNIEEPGGAVFATGPKIDDLDSIIPLIGEQDIFWLHVAMNYLLVLHVFQSLTDLSRDEAQLLRLENWVITFVYFLILVKVEAKALKDDDHVLSELEAINVLHEAVLPLIVCCIAHA